jgi:hypothetical protein
MYINNDPNPNAMRWHCRAECTWLGLAASGRVVGLGPWARHGPRRRQGPNSRLLGAYLVPGTGRQIADISRAPGLISENRGDAAGSAPPTHAATCHRTYQKADGSSLELYVVRVFHVCSRPAVNRMPKVVCLEACEAEKVGKRRGQTCSDETKRLRGGRGVRIRV